MRRKERSEKLGWMFVINGDGWRYGHKAYDKAEMENAYNRGGFGGRATASSKIVPPRSASFASRQQVADASIA